MPWDGFIVAVTVPGSAVPCNFGQARQDHVAHNLHALWRYLIERILIGVPVRFLAAIPNIDRWHVASRERKLIIFDRTMVVEKYALKTELACGSPDLVR